MRLFSFIIASLLTTASCGPKNGLNNTNNISQKIRKTGSLGQNVSTDPPEVVVPSQNPLNGDPVKIFQSIDRKFITDLGEDERLDLSFFYQSLPIKKADFKATMAIGFKKQTNEGRIRITYGYKFQEGIANGVTSNRVNSDYKFTYVLKALDNGNFLIAINWKSKGNDSDSPMALGLLRLSQAISKADWLYVRDDENLIGIIQLGKNSIGEYKTIPLDSKISFDNALTFQRSNKKFIAPNVPAMSFVFNKMQDESFNLEDANF